MAEYDPNYSPPAPIALTTWRCAESGAMIDGIPMLLDTGSDLTIVPQAVIEQFDVAPITGEQYELSGFDGNRSWASVVILDLIFSGKAFRGRYLISNDAVGVVGRDVLNHLVTDLTGQPCGGIPARSNHRFDSAAARRMHGPHDRL